jgi:hypothetical protein
MERTFCTAARAEVVTRATDIARWSSAILAGVHRFHRQLPSFSFPSLFLKSWLCRDLAKPTGFMHGLAMASNGNAAAMQRRCAAILDGEPASELPCPTSLALRVRLTAGSLEVVIPSPQPCRLRDLPPEFLPFLCVDDTWDRGPTVSRWGALLGVDM